MIKGNVSRAQDGIIACFGIIVIAVTPGTHAGAAIAQAGIGVGVKQPEGNVDALDLPDVIFFFEGFGDRIFNGA